MNSDTFIHVMLGIGILILYLWATSKQVGRPENTQEFINEYHKRDKSTKDYLTNSKKED